MKIWLTLVGGGKPAGPAYREMAPVCCKVPLLPGPAKLWLRRGSTGAPAARTQETALERVGYKISLVKGSTRPVRVIHFCVI